MTSPSPEAEAACSPRVAVVDLDRRVQQSLAEVLRVAGVEVVGTAGDVRAALELIASQKPDVLLLDPRLPDVDAGKALLSSIALGWPSIRVIQMGWTDAAAGGTFIPKSAQPDEFLAATLEACRG